jgi:aspartate kinase
MSIRITLPEIIFPCSYQKSSKNFLSTTPDVNSLIKKQSMKVFKFGGASIKSPESIRNMASIINQHREDRLVIVVSAMGKTTNNLESLFELVRDKNSALKKYDEIADYHRDIAGQLIREKENERKVENVLIALKDSFSNSELTENPEMVYDRIVSFGELISSTIVACYLSETGLPVRFADARKFIRTDPTHREGKIDWTVTCRLVREQLMPVLSDHMVLTQGFIGSTENENTTTLGREGSDFTAAILASCLDAKSVTIWKDVPGILNADPKKFTDPKLYDHLSFQEAAEMAYYGASVIHPKTIKPIANKNIPLFVKSFERPDLPGTRIDQGGPHPVYPTFVVKDNQCLVSFLAKDLAFINEKSLSLIFHVMDMLNIRINMMQNSAVSLTICVDNHSKKVSDMIQALENDFSIRFNENLQLITVKNYSPASVIQVMKDKKILVEQRTRNTLQIVIDPDSGKTA